MKKRLDQHLVDAGFAPSKTKAQEMIEAGQVFLIVQKSGESNSLNDNEKPQSQKKSAKKPSQQIDSEKIRIEIAEENILKFASRSGFKLEGLLDDLNLNVKNLKILDVGQSTGGFTDCVLQRGAAFVTGIDIGKNELAKRLAQDARVQAITGINIKDIRTVLDPKTSQFSMIVVDLSFISIEKVLSHLMPYLKNQGELVALVKPQFEVGSVNLDKKGIVKSPQCLTQLEQRIKKLAKELELVGIQYIAAKMKGRDGNQEFFLYGKKK
jgi:23S rRNA (cytidine1920-2'-O)/16S rRNA (cytidine1409-2'-O)-methyltransferase